MGGYIGASAPTLSPTTSKPGDFDRNQAERVAPANPNDPLSVQIQNKLNDLTNRPVYGASPTEQRFQDYQNQAKNLGELSGLRADYERTGGQKELSLLQQKLSQMGISVAPGAGASPTWKTDPESGLRTFAGFATKSTPDWQDILRATDSQLGNIPAIEKKLAEAGQTIIGEKLTGAEMREAELKQGLGTTGDLLGQLIEEKLRERIGDIDLKAQGLRSDVGASLASRGLAQSSFAGQRIAQTHMAEQQDRATARQGAFDAKQRTGGAIDDTIKQIEVRRRELSNKKTLAEATAAADVAYDFDAQSINQKFQSEIAQLELDAQSSGFLGTLAGGILGAAAGIFLGNPLGGAAVGSNLGGKL